MKIRIALAVFVAACAPLRSGVDSNQVNDVIIRGGTVYDGTGSPGRIADVAIKGQRVNAIGDLSHYKAKTEIDAHGLAVAPGFINMLSWAPETLIEDPRGMSDIKQGVTLEVFGEGESMGPMSDAMKKEA